MVQRVYIYLILYSKSSLNALILLLNVIYYGTKASQKGFYIAMYHKEKKANGKIYSVNGRYHPKFFRERHPDLPWSMLWHWKSIQSEF